MRTRILTAIAATVLIAQSASAQGLAPYVSPELCVERVVPGLRGTRVQRFAYFRGHGWLPVSDKHPCNRSRQQLFEQQWIIPPSQVYAQLTQTRTQTQKGKKTVPTQKKKLDCDPKATYRCLVMQKVGNTSKLVQVGTTWKFVNFFTAYRTGQELIAYVAADDPEKRFVCTQDEWRLIMRRVPEPAAERLEQPPLPKDSKVLDMRTRGGGV